MKKTWRDVKRPIETAAFLAEYEALCVKHGIRIGSWWQGDDGGLHLESFDEVEQGKASANVCGADQVYTYGEHGS